MLSNQVVNLIEIRKRWFSRLVPSYFLQQQQSGPRSAGGNIDSTCDDVTITDERDPETASQTGSVASERGIDIGRVASWATDFEKLLSDPIGLRTFAVSVFLKKIPTFFSN